MRSFAEAHPELLAEWDPSNVIKPDEISYGSNKKVLWKGRCGHFWEATIKNRGNNHGCPYCSGNKVLKGFNDLASQRPRLVKEWSEFNEKRADEYTKRSIQRIIWKCSTCGYIWRARIADRSAGSGCPACAGERINPGFNDLETLYPAIASEWSVQNERPPNEISPKTTANVWWHCRKCGNEWQGVVATRVKGSICPYCIKEMFRKRREEREREKIEKIRKDQEAKRYAISYYAQRCGEKVDCMNEDIIGLPIAFYFPERKAAVEFSSRNHRRGYGYRMEFAKNWLCINSGIKMIRILENGEPEFNNCICITRTDDTPEVMEAAIQAVFNIIGIDADIDLNRDSGKFT
ncbi:MAG: zinc-ribbon domain-containing protein [Lachnospiraceae bacterium]|nr:zinc-ribbon domain-containing protein [Lachnospiraceae bacterium]